jgi:hypothetical protein
MMMSAIMRSMSAPHRARIGAIVGCGATLVLSMVLLAFEVNEGDISSAPLWWTFIIIITAGALLVTAVLLIISRDWRPFGVGFLLGTIVALPLEAGLFVLLLIVT